MAEVVEDRGIHAIAYVHMLCVACCVTEVGACRAEYG